MADYKHPEVLVTTDWVAEHLGDAKVRLVEVDVDTGAYDKGHVQKAVGWNWQTQLQDGLRRDITDKKEFEELCSKSGIANDSTVVLYGDNNNWFAAWAFWQFKYYGHADVRLMNGRRKKWELELHFRSAPQPPSPHRPANTGSPHRPRLRPPLVLKGPCAAPHPAPPSSDPCDPPTAREFRGQ